MKSFLQFLQRAAKYFRGTKRVWRKPPQTKLLIIDQGTASPLDEMFAEYNPHVMAIRGESINMLALLRALPRIHLGALAYIEAYIDFVKPKLILSRTDNNPTMWQLKRRPNATYQVALVQNGMRCSAFFLNSNPSGIKQNPRKVKYYSDKYFVFGRSVEKILGAAVESYFEFSGSLFLNIFNFVETKGVNPALRSSLPNVGLISTFRPKEKELNNSQILIYESLDKYLEKNNYQLSIIGNGISRSEQELEIKFFSNIFKKSKFQLGFFRSMGDSYEHLKNKKWIITCQSTLGYESLVSSVPVGFLHPETIIYNGRDFDASSNLGSSGIFWTRSDDPQEHNRIFTYLDTVSDEQWERDSGWIRDQLMAYDFGNTKIRAYVESVLADSLKGN